MENKCKDAPNGQVKGEFGKGKATTHPNKAKGGTPKGATTEHVVHGEDRGGGGGGHMG